MSSKNLKTNNGKIVWYKNIKRWKVVFSIKNKMHIFGYYSNEKDAIEMRDRINTEVINIIDILEDEQLEEIIKNIKNEIKNNINNKIRKCTYCDSTKIFGRGMCAKHYMQVIRHGDIINKNRLVDKNNKSGIKGVSFNNKSCKWVAQIYRNGKVNYLGAFEEKEDAIRARLDAENKFDNTNIE